MPAYILRSSKHAPTALAYLAQNFMFQPAVLLLLFQALAIFCGHMFSQSLLHFDQYSLSQHTVFIPELPMLGARPVSARALAMHRACVRSNALRPKPRIGWGWDLVSLIGRFKTHRLAARKLGALSISALASSRLLCNVHVRRGCNNCNSQIRVVMLEDLAVSCNQFIHVSHSILMLCKLQQI